jgi:hypothetical protein
MKGIDCLLRNTFLKDKLAVLVQHMGYELAGSGRDASIHGVYNELSKAGVEVDLRTVGQLYADASFPADPAFTANHHIDEIVGRQLEKNMRRLILQEPKDGEKKIGKEASGEYVANRLANAFYDNTVADNTTTSVQRKLREAVAKVLEQRYAGELPNGKTIQSKEDFVDLLNRKLNEEADEGFRTIDGKVNNIHTVLHDALKYVDEYTKAVDGKGDPVLKQQWESYIKGIEEASNTLLLNTDEARNVVYSALHEAGYAKNVKGGKLIPDYNKMAGTIHDSKQVRDIVKQTLVDRGFHEDTANRIADSMKKEYLELKGKTLAYAEHRFNEMQAAQKAGKSSTPHVDISDMIDKRLGEWDNWKKLADDQTKPLVFGRAETRKIIVEALKKEGYGKELSNNSVVLDWRTLHRDINEPDLIRKQVIDMLQKQGHTGPVADKVADALQSMYGEMKQEIKDRAKQRLDAQQAAIGKPAAGTRTDLERLAELHDLGAFDGGSYQKLLNQRLGIDNATTQDMAELKDIAARVADISRMPEVGGRSSVASTAFSQLQREAERVLSRNMNNRSKSLKAVKAMQTAISIGNVSLLANPMNLLENNLSGYQAVVEANGLAMKQMGKEVGFHNKELWRAVHKDVVKGGIEYGDAGSKLQHIAGFEGADTFDFKKHPKRALATLALAPARAGLNAADAANKAVLHKLYSMMALHKAIMQENPGMTKEQATHYIHEAMYGQNFQDMKVKANNILTKAKLRNNEEARVRLANDMVKAKLYADGFISEKSIDAAFDAGFQTSSIALGHEANNIFSRSLQAGRTQAHKREMDYVKQGDYGAAARQRLVNSLWFNGVNKFAGGGVNWAILKGQQMGTGLLNSGQRNRDIDYTDPASIERTMKERLQANRRTATGLSGLSLAALALGGVFMAGLGQDKETDDEGNEEGNLSAGFRSIRESQEAHKNYLKLAPNLAILAYLASMSANDDHDAALDASVQLINKSFNLGSGLGDKFVRAGRDLRRGTPDASLRARGQISSVLGDMISAPGYKPAKKAYQLVHNWINSDEPIESDFTKPMGYLDGTMANGVLQDMGLYKPYEQKVADGEIDED